LKKFRDALISIAAAIIAVLPILLLSPTDKLNNVEVQQYVIVFSIIVLVLIILAFFGDFIIAFFKDIIIDSYTNFVYDHYKSTLEYLDSDGQYVSYNAVIWISKLSFRWGKDTELKIFTDEPGKVLPESGKGINAKILHQSNTKDLIIYSTKFSKNNIIDKKHHINFATKFIDTFNQNGTTYWEIKPTHYCKYYEFEVIHPNPSSEVTLTFQQKENDKNEDDKLNSNIWYSYEHMGYSTYIRSGKRVVTVFMLNLLNTHTYKISWEFN